MKCKRYFKKPLDEKLWLKPSPALSFSGFEVYSYLMYRMKKYQIEVNFCKDHIGIEESKLTIGKMARPERGKSYSKLNYKDY